MGRLRDLSWVGAERPAVSPPKRIDELMHDTGLRLRVQAAVGAHAFDPERLTESSGERAASSPSGRRKGAAQTLRAQTQDLHLAR